MEKAIVLLSGGIDSATSLYWAKQRGYKCFCLIFDYSQRHKKEIQTAKLIAKKSGCDYKILKIDIPADKSSLLNRRITIKKQKPEKATPATYVPSRNIIFLSFAASFAETKNIDTIIIGANQIDYSNYPDCRGEFIKAFQKALNKGTKFGASGKKFKIIAPLLNKTKAQIIKTAFKLEVPLELTWSCYVGGARPCGECPSCVIRAKGFKEAGADDPVIARSTFASLSVNSATKQSQK